MSNPDKTWSERKTASLLDIGRAIKSFQFEEDFPDVGWSLSKSKIEDLLNELDRRDKRG
jgi:hypothetical protein